MPRIADRLTRLEGRLPEPEASAAFRARIERARARLRADGYDLDQPKSPEAIARADALKKIFEKSRRSGPSRSWI